MPDPTLFELPYDPVWGLDEHFFLDVEHRYTKSHRLLREAAGDLSGKRILDIGCSRGLMLERFRRYDGVEFVAIELEPEMLELARARGIAAEPHQINVFEDGQIAARLPYEDASLDIVLAAEIIEHIVDTQGFLAEIGRVLRPGGVVFRPRRTCSGGSTGSTCSPGATSTCSTTGSGSARTSGMCARSRPRCCGSSWRRPASSRSGSPESALALSSLTGPPAIARRLDELATGSPKLSDDILLVARKVA